jgi:ABC-type phosphate transport system permease subunit
MQCECYHGNAEWAKFKLNEEEYTMVNPEGITIEYKNNFFATFASTLVAVLVAVPVAMFVSYTVLKAGNANASTYQQTATASPVTTLAAVPAPVRGAPAGRRRENLVPSTSACGE